VPEAGGRTLKEESPLANYRASGYGKPTVLSFHSGACSGCGSEFAACGTWNAIGGSQRSKQSDWKRSLPRSTSEIRNIQTESNCLISCPRFGTRRASSSDGLRL
jgi:hypothetical protein